MRCLRNPPGWLVPALAVGAIAFFALRKKSAEAGTSSSSGTPMPRPTSPSAAVAAGQRQIGPSIFDPTGGLAFGLNVALASAEIAQKKAQERAVFNAQADVGRLMSEWRAAKDAAQYAFAEYKKLVGADTPGGNVGYRRDFLYKQFKANMEIAQARASTLKQFGVSVPE